MDRENKQTNIYFIYIFLLFILLDTIYYTLLCFEFVIILYLVSPVPKGLLITHMHCKEKKKAFAYTSVSTIHSSAYQQDASLFGDQIYFLVPVQKLASVSSI